MDGDKFADREEQLTRTSTGTYYGDVNKDGYSEEVARDKYMDGRIDTVDTTRRGSTIDTVSAEQVMEPGSEYMVDRHPGEDDTAANMSEVAATAHSTIPDKSASYDATDLFSAGEADVGGSDSTSYDSSSADTSSLHDSRSSYDAGSSSASYDAGSSSSYDSGDGRE
jgi:hypothetical protein